MSRTKTPDPLITFVDDFAVDAPGTIQARRASADLGIEPIGRATAQILTVLARAAGATSVVEVGTGAGVALLALLAGMPAGGTVTSVDREAEHQGAARDALKAAGIPHTRYRLITGEALSVLPRLRADAYDLVFIDADLLEYPEYLEEALRIVSPGGLVVFNHALLGGRVADTEDFDDDTLIVRDTLEATRTMDGLTAALIPVGDGLLVCTVDARS